MAVSEAIIGLGTLVEVRGGDDTQAYQSIGEVIDITPPSDSFAEIDVTHMQSDDGVQEFIAGLTDPGTMSLTVNYVPGSTADEFILAWKTSREKRETRITYLSGRTQVVRTFVRAYTPAIPVADKMTATIELRCSGASTFAG